MASRMLILATATMLGTTSMLTVTDAAAATNASEGIIELYILPHTHADVGWLQTVDSLSRLNVSRILDGVVGNLMNDTLKRRRFVWDEMAFLQLWWDGQATDAQKLNFKQLVSEGRIEFVDNGWSQHDMGCTTLDSMISNWEMGHQWLLKNFGPAAQPKIGWSLDPFGLSASQAVLQALMGMEAWVFTRVTNSIVDQMKIDKNLEFVWRASSALPSEQSEIFAHILESYYCMPLPTYAFEWGPDKGAVIPTKDNIIKLSHGLANITQQRSQWFRTENVLIPWGCDYQYQNADLVYEKTDYLIDTINAHPEWGVHAQYTTPSEYLKAIQMSTKRSGVTFPVKSNGSSFFPYNDWSGYFTSRPSLKGNSQKAVSQLLAAEALFALRAKPGQSPLNTDLYEALETARKNNGIVQHHDAITGTGCSNPEGCSGNNQITGAHNIIGDYQNMLVESMASSRHVIETVLAQSTGLDSLSTDPADLGKILEGKGDGGDAATVVIYNPLAEVRTEAVTIPIPVCAVDVMDLKTQKFIPSQVTAAIGIGDGQPPYFDFELQFIATNISALGYREYQILPTPDGNCGGGDLRHSAFTKHKRAHPISPSDTADSSVLQEKVFAEAIRRQGDVSGDPLRWMSILQEVQAIYAPERVGRNHTIVLENPLMMVYVDITKGIQAVYDKKTGRNISLTHDLMRYTTNKNDAYGFSPVGAAEPVLTENVGPSLKCTSWRQTMNCDPGGKRQPKDDLPCDKEIFGRQSGFCECAGGIQRSPVGCDLGRSVFTCTAVCNESGLVQTNVKATTVALGPILQEVRLQISDEHKTRIRLWVTDDPVVGGRIEFAHRIGVLEEYTEVASRFQLGGDQGSDAMTMFSEENGYEAIPHQAGTGASEIQGNLYPSQMSAFIANTSTLMGVALDRSHAVGSLYNGSLEIVLHRRGGPFVGTGSTVVLDDADRIFPQTWLTVGDRQTANRARIASRQRLNHPLIVACGPIKNAGGEDDNGIKALPSNLHLQSVRSISADNSQFLLRLQHLYTDGSDSVLATPASVNVLDLISTLRQPLQVDEMTLDGMRFINSTMNRQHFPTSQKSEAHSQNHRKGSLSDNSVEVHPFELRTFKME